MDAGNNFVPPGDAKDVNDAVNTDRRDAAGNSFKFIERGAPFGEVAEQYLNAMLAFERTRASRLVMDAVTQGMSIREFYLHVLQPVQYEIGWLWQSGQISVGHEHYCTNSTQLIMSMLYPRLFGGERTGRRVIAACVQGELHELGLRMLSDFFEMDGWDSHYLGANMPPEGIVSTMTEFKPDVLAIGVSMHYHLDEAQRLIRAVRDTPETRDTIVLVGGYTCRVVDGLWRKLGADGTATDAQQAVAVASKLLDERQRNGR